MQNIKTVLIQIEVSNYLLCYYLKYHFCDNFRFNFFDDKTNLLDALNELKIIPIDKLFNLSELEEYMYYLYCNNWLKYYLDNPECKDGINIIIKNMERANQLNPKDIFPQYWLAYFNTEKAIYSDKKADYKKALIEWNKVIQHELFTTSPVIKITYDKLAFCNEKLGNIEEAKLYKDKSKNVSKLLDFNYKEYMHFGW